MSRDEVVELIGTIAKSGTAELLRKLQARPKDAGATQELIGQFGVGFYSTFMVADKVTLVTRRAGETEGTRWESDGEGTYTIETVDDAPQGTSVTLHLKPEDDEDRPVRLHRRVEDPGDRQAVLGLHRRGRSGWRREGDDRETLNSMKALWARPAHEVTDEEYNEFYRHISHDWTDPLETIHMKAEGTFEYEALLFIPSRAPFDLFQRDGKRGVQLYVKRVFIMDDCEALMPALPALRQGRGRRARPVAQRLPRDPAAGPADPDDPAPPGQEGAVHDQGPDDQRRRAVPHVLGASSAGRSRRGCSTTPTTARRMLEVLVVRVHPRRGRADHAAPSTSSG